MEPKVKKLLDSFFNKYSLKTFAKREVVIQPSGNRIFFLTKGVVRMFCLSKEGVELTINIYRPYSLFPLSLLLNNRQDKYTYNALTEVAGYFASKNALKNFIKKNPEVLFDLLKRIYKGLEGFFKHLEMLLSKDANKRIINQLVVYAKRFGQKNQDKIIFDLHLTHHQLASQTGLARESVSKELKKLQNKGLIGYLGKQLFIYNLSKLEKLIKN